MTAQNFAVGDIVRRAEGAPTYSYETDISLIVADADYTVRRVTTRKVLVRPADEDLARNTGSVWVLKEHMTPKTVEPEKYLDKFVPTDGSEYIKVDDPRVAYIWEGARALATEKGYCDVFDTIADELGIEGRETVWWVTYTLADLDDAEGNFPVKATSAQAANEILLSLVPDAKITATETY